MGRRCLNKRKARLDRLEASLRLAPNKLIKLLFLLILASVLVSYRISDFLTDIIEGKKNYPQIPQAKALEIFKKYDPVLVQLFSEANSEIESKYDYLFSYFVTGFLLYRGNYPSFAYYPGASSKNGPGPDALEGFSRIIPVICSWLSSGREKTITTLNGKVVDLEEIFQSGLVSGTDPTSQGYWGQMLNKDQRICEAADLALSIWLVRDSLWSKLDRNEKRNVINWLLSVNNKEVSDNNWHLFPVIINQVIASLGYEADPHSSQDHYSRFKSFYQGDGWFSDGPHDIYDYYNAWSIHYTLFWLDRINPEFDPEFIQESLKKFAKNYIYFFSPQGIPILGRSVCYRMAASAPLIATHIQDPELVPGGLVRRAFDSLWSYFIAKGAVTRGNVTQGYYKTDLRFLDNYSGPASCLWALRSLVMAFTCKKSSPFWTDLEKPLPVEISDYHISIPSIGWTVTGIKNSQEIIISTGKSEKGNLYIDNFTLIHQIASFLLGRPLRPKNEFAKYELSQYSSKNPFCGCRK
jgi:hypothetical protein